MQFIADHWFTILLGVLLVASVALNVSKFTSMSSAERYELIRGWLLQAVIWAESLYGSGTGRVKLSVVYSAFCEQLPWLAKVIPFETFAQYVDDALEEMRHLIESNAAIAELVSIPPEDDQTAKVSGFAVVDAEGEVHE